MLQWPDSAAPMQSEEHSLLVTLMMMMFALLVAYRCACLASAARPFEITRRRARMLHSGSFVRHSIGCTQQ